MKNVTVPISFIDDIFSLRLLPTTAASAYHALLQMGFLVGYYQAGNILRFDPALTVDEKDIVLLLECIDSILETTS